MRRTFVLFAAVLAGLTTATSAQQRSIKLRDVAGVWRAETMMGPKDSVVATSVLTATADGKRWTITFPKRKPIKVRVVTVGGDSIVTEAGPYPSYLKPGQTVTLLRIVGHYKGKQMSGTFEAQYASGDKIGGKISATRRK